MNTFILGIAIIGVLAFGFFILPGLMPEGFTVLPGDKECRGLASTPTITVDTPDMYGGANLTTKNLVRQIGLSTFTEIAGGSTFDATGYSKQEIAFGIGATDDDDEPFGCHVASWEVPCEEVSTVSAGDLCKFTDASGTVRGGVIDDMAAGTSMTSVLIDPDDGNAITSTSTFDIDAGQERTITWTLTGVNEQSYGNPFCNENVVTIHYNSTAFDDIKLTSDAGAEFPTTSTPSHYTAAAGYKAKNYIVPVLVSSQSVIRKIYLDADDTENPAGTTNITIYEYDGNFHQDNDVTPPQIKCGVEDEDAAQVGGSTDFSDVIYIEEA